ncbi:target of Nesh-SH3 isoform X2 [Trichomycterus rosablanca]|uniref:target of Nesh-SH3 isoform X2 n=1 Tax=Trichomycterus rosablanca TaxID=2290929 RepID=UPI002F35948E
MTAFLLLVILSEVLLPNLTCASRVRRQNTKVRISSAGDTIMLKFLQSDQDTKLEGYIVGYGSNMFSKQFIQLPENGEPYETVIDAEPKYLIAVQPIIEDEVKKECAVIGSVTPTSVLLSWGTILRPPYTDANLVDCSDDSQYTVRYKEKESSDNWSYQTCPTTDTVIEKLNLDTTYEFGVRAETDTISGTWSPPVTHNTDIIKPVSPVIQTSSPEPTTEEPHPTEAYVQPLQILQNVTSSRMTPTSRHTTSFPTPKTTLGPESDGIASSPSSEDFLFLTHTYTHPPMSMPPSKTTNIFQPKSVTTTQQQFFTTLLQLTTNKTPVSTTKTQSSKNKILSSTGKAPLNTERPLKRLRTTAIHSAAHHQPETSTTQVQSTTIKYHPKATQKNLITPQHRTVTLQPITTQSQTYTTKSQIDTTQSQPHPTQPKAPTIQSQPHPTQPKAPTIQSQPHPTQPKAPTIQSQPHPTQSEAPTTQSQPHPTQSQPHTTQTPPISTESNTTLSLPSTSKTQLRMTQPTPRKPQEPSKTQSKRILQKSSTAQPQNTKEIYQPVTNLLTNIILENSVTNIPLNLSNTKSDIHQDFESPHTTPQHPLAPSSTEAGILEDMASSHTTSQHLPHIATDTPSPTQRRDSYSTSSTETNTYLRNPPCCSTTFKLQPVVEQHYHPTSATKSHLNTSPKSNNSQNSPQTEKTVVNKKPPGSKQGSFNSSYSVVYQSAPTITQSSSPLQDTQPPTSPVSLKSDRNQDQINSTSPAVHPSVTTVKQRQDNTLSSMVSPSASTVKQRRGNSSLPLVPLLVAGAIQSPHGEKHKGIAQPKPVNEPLGSLELQGNPLVPFKKKLNQVEKEKEVKTGDLPDLKQLDQLPLLKPQATPVAEKSVQSTAAPTPTLFTSDGSRFDWVGNSSGFSSVPVSDVDAMGKKRFVAPHVIYKTDKPPDEPCSVTQSLSYFPEEEGVAINVTGPPKTPPTNLTVVTVEGCPSFIILDWEKTDNETTEYDVTSSIKSPNGDEVSVVTTNQTHTAVENLKPESSYEFTVIPKNELGSGPPSEPVSFNTESADPRVSEIPTGKNAIWSSFPFKADSYSECTGNMYVKRTWYRKFVGIQLCNSLRYKIYLSDSLKGKFYNIGDVAGNGEDHCQFVDSYLDGRTGGPPAANRLPLRKGFFRSIRQEPVRFGKIGGNSHINYVAWYECGVPIPGSW